jgi:hypothetical protein
MDFSTADEILMELMEDGWDAGIIMRIASRLSTDGKAVWSETEPEHYDHVHGEEYFKNFINQLPQRPEHTEQNMRALREAFEWHGFECPCPEEDDCRTEGE